jgi:hypothetical protein
VHKTEGRSCGKSFPKTDQTFYRPKAALRGKKNRRPALRVGFFAHMMDKDISRRRAKRFIEDGPNVFLSNEESCFSDISKQMAGIRLPDIISVVV